MIIVHPNDKTTDFLKILYEGSKLDETSSNSKIEEELKKAKEIMLLGHGTEYGLLAPQGKEQFGRLIINSGHVQFLRNKIIIGLWCNANIFAMKYNLTGLFSGMVISEISEALDWLNFIPSQEEIEKSRNRWVENLSKFIKENNCAFSFTGYEFADENCILIFRILGAYFQIVLQSMIARLIQIYNSFLSALAENTKHIIFHYIIHVNSHKLRQSHSAIQKQRQYTIISLFILTVNRL